MNNCPGWIFDVAVAAAAKNSLQVNYPFKHIGKYAEGLAQHYLEMM